MSAIRKESKDFKVDYRLVAAIMNQESAGNPWAIRFEPGARSQVTTDYWQIAKKNLITPDTEQLCQMCSFGLGQTMGHVARNMGFSDALVRLFEPEISTHYTVLLLAQLAKRFGFLESVISAYNQGYPRKDASGVLLNYETYVKPVLTFMSELNNS